MWSPIPRRNSRRASCTRIRPFSLKETSLDGLVMTEVFMRLMSSWKTWSTAALGTPPASRASTSIGRRFFGAPRRLQTAHRNDCGGDVEIEQPRPTGCSNPVVLLADAVETEKGGDILHRRNG